MWYFRRRMWWVFLLIVCSMPNTLVQAEMYVAGQVGVTLPQSLSNVEVSDPSIGLPSGSTFSNLDLQTSVMYGAKLGYYFESLKWLGVETEVFNTTPHVKQQPITVTVPGSPSFTINPAGSYLRVLTWAPINLVVRYQMGKFEPYAGVGMGIFFSAQRRRFKRFDFEHQRWTQHASRLALSRHEQRCTIWRVEVQSRTTWL